MSLTGDIRGRTQRPVPSVPSQRFRLACGADLIVSRRKGAPVTAVQMHLRGGHSLDPVGLEGTAYLTGGLVDQGTLTHTEEQLADLLEPAGGHLSGDASGVSGTIAGDHTKLLLELFCQAITSPRYPKAKVERQKARLVERLTVMAEDPRSQSGKLFRRLVYGDHWLGRPAQGDALSVARIERKHLVRHHKQNWVASRALIAVSGDVQPKAVKQLLDRGLKDWKPGKPLGPIDEHFPEPGPRSGAFTADRNQVHVFLGHLGVKRSDPDYDALVLMDHVLGTGPGFTNRISRRLRDELGLAYTVHAAIHNSAGVLPGTFTAYIGTSPEHLTTATEGFLEEIRRIQAEPVTAEELDLAKSYLIGSLAMGFERASQRVSFLISADRYGLPKDHLETLPARFAAVTAEDVQRVARKHLWQDRCCLAVGGPVSEREVKRVLARVSR